MDTGRPLIFDIAKGSFVDGPGIRTTVFFKGCPLRCVWCHNPEARFPHQELFFFAEDCIGCGRCSAGKTCFTLAKREVGLYYPPTGLLTLLLSDKTYYLTSGGGVTFSGGEPLLFIDYLAGLLPLLKDEGIHITIQTCGFFDYPLFEQKILPYVDLVHFDLKLLDPAEHLKYTGQPNAQILANFTKLVSTGIPVLPRMALIPDYTATCENLAQAARFLAGLHITNCEFLPYNPLGIAKAERLGRTLPSALARQGMTPAMLEHWVGYYNSQCYSHFPCLKQK
jgi:pyruvate formate lyase activating enzyme